MSKKAVNFRIFKSDHRRLRVLAEGLGLDMAELINLFIHKHVSLAPNDEWLLNIKHPEEGPEHEKVEEKSKRSTHEYKTGFAKYFDSFK